MNNKRTAAGFDSIIKIILSHMHTSLVLPMQSRDISYVCPPSLIDVVVTYRSKFVKLGNDVSITNFPFFELFCIKV